MGLNNTNSFINLNLLQLNVNIYTLLLVKEPNNTLLESKLKLARIELEDCHDGASLAD